MAVVVMVCRRWRRRHPDLVLVPLALALFASQAVRSAFGLVDDRGLAIFLAGTGASLFAWGVPGALAAAAAGSSTG